MSWKVKVDRRQRVVFGVQGPNYRMFMDEDCKSSYQMENLRFEIQDRNGNYLEDSRTNYSNLDLNKWDGMSWIEKYNLDAGTYTI
jgi:hypothetical protein